MKLLRRSKKRRSRAARRSQMLRNHVAENLESRQLLVGQVTAVVRGNDLIIQGDESANQVEIAFDRGNVAVLPKNGTRINGRRGQFVAFENTDTVPGNILVSMRAGDDTVILSRELVVAKDVRVNGQEGADTLGLNDVIVRDDLVFYGGAGDDRVSIENTRVVDDTNLKLSNGDDLVRIVASQLRDNLTLRANRDADSVVMDDVVVRGNAYVRTSIGDDVVSLNNVRVQKQLRMQTSTGTDNVVIEDSTVAKRAYVHLGNGEDSLIVGDDTTTPASGNTFRSVFRAAGGRSSDSIQVNADTTFRDRRREGSFEGDAAFDGTGAATTDADTLRDDVNGLIRSVFTAAVDATPATVSVVGTGDTETFATTDETITLTGRTANNGSVEIDADGDGTFERTVQADAVGDYTADVTLAVGNQQVAIRNPETPNAIRTFNVDRLTGTVVRMTTNQGNIDVQLFDDEFPVTAQNFLGYFDRYGDNMIIHRSPEDFVIQGGGFTVDGTTVTEVSPDTPIQNEFNADRSNVAGTLSMALRGGDENSGTSEWFFNVTDNVNLDDVRHTVFGQLIGGTNGPSMPIVQAINALEIFDISEVTGVSALGETPLIGFTPSTNDVTGTVSVADGSFTVFGTGTDFTNEVTSGDRLTIGSDRFTVDVVRGADELSVTEAATTDLNAQSATVATPPDESNYVIFSNIRELTDALNEL